MSRPHRGDERRAASSRWGRREEVYLRPAHAVRGGIPGRGELDRRHRAAAGGHAHRARRRRRRRRARRRRRDGLGVPGQLRAGRCARLATGEQAVAQVARERRPLRSRARAVHVWWSAADEMSLPHEPGCAAGSCCPPGCGWRCCSSRRSAIVLLYSFLTRGAYGGLDAPWTLENYTRLADPLYLTILRALVLDGARRPRRSAWCWRFPLALFISRAGRRKNLYLQLVILPFWTSFLVRTYAWMFLLRDTGLINTVLHGAGRDPGAAAAALQRRRGAAGTGLRLPAVHGAAALRHAGAARPGAARSRGGPGRAAVAPRSSACSCRSPRPAFAPAPSWSSSRAWARI